MELKDIAEKLGMLQKKAAKKKRKKKTAKDYVKLNPKGMLGPEVKRQKKLKDVMDNMD